MSKAVVRATHILLCLKESDQRNHRQVFYFDKVQKKKKQQAEVRTQEYDQEDVDAEEEHNRPLNASYVSKFDIIKI